MPSSLLFTVQTTFRLQQIYKGTHDWSLLFSFKNYREASRVGRFPTRDVVNSHKEEGEK